MGAIQPIANQVQDSETHANSRGKVHTSEITANSNDMDMELNTDIAILKRQPTCGQ